MTKHRVISVSTLFLLLFAVTNEVTPADEGGSAVIKGKVVFEGKAPKPKKIKMSADPKCMEIHGDTPALFQTLLIGEAGELQNVLVYVKEGARRPEVQDAHRTRRPRSEGLRVLSSRLRYSGQAAA